MSIAGEYRRMRPVPSPSPSTEIQKREPRSADESARARAGAFERFSVDSSRNVLNRTIENISSALSQIEDADIAVESARLVRSLILIDAGVSSARFASASKSAAAQLLAPDLFGTGR